MTEVGRGPLCPECGGPVSQAGPGRRRTYCTDRCRIRAYRRRKAGEKKTLLELEAARRQEQLLIGTLQEELTRARNAMEAHGIPALDYTPERVVATLVDGFAEQVAVERLVIRLRAELEAQGHLDTWRPTDQVIEAAIEALRTGSLSSS